MNNTITATFDHVIHHSVEFAFPSLFTKDDVIKVIRDLETQLKAAMEEEVIETKSKSLTKEQIKEIAENAASSVASEGLNLIDDYDLTMNCREVELDSVELDENKIADEIERAISDWFSNNEDSE